MTALDRLNMGVVDLDEHGLVAFANLRARRWLGRELQGMSFADLLSPGSRLFFLTHLFPLLHSGQDLEEAYLAFHDAEELELPVLLNGTHLEGGGKRLSFMPIRRRAIIERQLLQAKQEAEEAMRAQQATLEALKEAQARLALQDRLVVMGTLAAGVGHELNNPLAYVISNLESLTGTTMSEDEKVSLADVKEGVRRIQGIVASLKALSRSEEERKVPIDLNQMGQIACRLSSNESSLCQLDTDWCPQSVLVLGDEGKMTQVLLNLLLNACQAFPTPDKTRNRIRVHTWRAGQEAFVEVADNGPGIPGELRKRVFDPFFTTKPVGSGTGLGLSICQGIVKSFGGQLELLPSAEGACFRIRLPLHAAPEPAAPLAPSSPKRLAGLRCLVIDDDPRVARILQKLLSSCDCQVALGGNQGVEVLRQEEPFDLILCDLMMPDRSGLEVYRAAPPFQQKRFVFVSGGVSEEAEDTLNKLGVPLLDKPFDQAKLVEVYGRLGAPVA